MRALLLDAALAAAKGHAHTQVEARHVLFAVAKHFRDRPEVLHLLPIAKNALQPRGTFYGVPEVTPEAAALLDSFLSEREAIAGLLDALSSGSKPEGEQSGLAQAELPTQEEAREVLSPITPAGVGAELTNAVLAELEGLIGLASVKRRVMRVIAVVQANEERTKAGLPTVSPGLHLVFTGPPGTGKTTIARLVARLYASTGALPGANFAEASRSDLVAGYVGQTALKTAGLIRRTRPGVLFIDEAYSLTPTHDSDFGAEAIATLVKAMEDYRHEFAVIIAGYGEEMSALIASNPGLRSRFKTYIEFPDYTPAELKKIFEGFAKSSAIGLSNGAIEKAEEIFRHAAGKPGFGNARFARSLFEEAYARMSARAAADGIVRVEELMEITVEDVDWQAGAFNQEIRRLGFGGDDGKAGGSRGAGGHGL